MTEAELLAVPLGQPQRVFTDRANIKATYRTLAAQYHPDHHGGDGKAFAHLQSLHMKAQDLDERDDWPGMFEFALGVRYYELDYHTRVELDFGTMYVASQHVAFKLDKANTDLFKAGIEHIRAIKFPDKKFATADRPAMAPEPEIAGQTADGENVAVFKKQPSQLMLSDVLAHYGGKLEGRHVAWIINRLCGLNCALTFGPKLAHGGLDLNSYFIDPAAHTGVLLGGWWFAQALGRPLRGLPAASGPLVPLPASGKPLATPAVTGALVRAVGRRLLGSVHGSKLVMDKTIPAPMLSWLRSPPIDDPLKDMAAWEHALTKAYGKRSFHKMELTEEQLYPK